MTKTGINAIAPLEPFKLFHRINQNVINTKSELQKLKLERAEQVSIPGRSNQPVGIAQIGFACFWPNGGGLLPPGSSTTSSSQNTTMPPQLASPDVTAEAPIPEVSPANPVPVPAN